MKVAAVDIGTNTVRLLVAEELAECLVDLERREVITRLGEGLDRSGVLATAAMERARVALQECARVIAGHRVDRAGAVATAATRGAANGADFVAMATAALGFAPRVIDGVEEAHLSFAGATAGRTELEPVTVIDVGGGSTEFVSGVAEPEAAVSVDIGSVRLTERFDLEAPRPAAGIEEVRAHVDSLFAPVPRSDPPGAVIGVGGTFTTLAAIHIGTAAAIAYEGTRLGLDQLEHLTELLWRLPVTEIAELPAVAAGRAPVLRAGAVCAERAVGRTGASRATVSQHDILDGLARSLVDTAS